MSLFSTKFCDSLPLTGREILKKQVDWVYLYDKWSRNGPTVFLESAGPVNDGGRWIILAGYSEKEIFAHEDQTWISESSSSNTAPFDIWQFLDEVGKIEKNYSPLPFCLSKAWFGLFSYEFERDVITRKVRSDGQRNSQIPEYYFFKPGSILAFDRKTKECFSFGNASLELLENYEGTKNSFRVHSLRPLLSLKQYESMVRKVQTYIANGDIYQANIAQPFQAKWEGNPGNLYRLLREINPGPFMGIFQGRRFTVVSSSPERLVTGRGDWLETRPIAGTRPRGGDEIKDLQFQWELKTNLKEQAEHLMLVDLERNDLGRVSRYGTVEVKRFAEVEPYSRVQHLVSVIQGQRRPNASVSDILRSFFPGGTITGCPKIRCTEIIEELEERPRGYYTGSMGYTAPGPCFDFNILIRTFTLLENGNLEFLAGAGIVADSEPQREYMETLYKAEALAQALGTSVLTKP